MASPDEILADNLARLRRTEPELALRIEAATALPLDFEPSKAGPLTASIEHQGRKLALASRYDPMAEAAKLIGGVDHGKQAGFAVLGLGLGYHVQLLAKGLDDQAILIVYEPDIRFLRAVLQRVDHTSWLGRPNIFLADAQVDRATIVATLERFATFVTQGTILVNHPVCRQIHPEETTAFGQMVAEALAYCRTNVATALVNAARTVRNVTANIAYYAASANTNELHQAARGYPAVCVGAGPSLARNVNLLRDPAVRRNVVVITAQTTLKPLLDRGIRPDFVTALDYHEISKRFYEGLESLPDVTLVAEPKVHGSVVDSFPGPIRMTNNRFLDRFLGEGGVPIIPISQGATVAHLSFYLAQHLGCNPVILIGQDLGFSDGLYYCPGTAIHDVWAAELGRFNTLEVMEWQRIVRHRGHLKLQPDIHGRPTYSDEQMLTYLKQFERDFMNAPETVINATEGGLPIEHTEPMTLAEPLARHATRPVPRLPIPLRGFDPQRLTESADLTRRRIDQVNQIRRTCQKTIPLLRQMLDTQHDRKRMDALFSQLQKHKEKIERLDVSFGLINDLNTIGAFKRARADRAIIHADDSELEVQRRQLERDLENVDWLIQACDEGLTLFENASGRIERFRQGLKQKEKTTDEHRFTQMAR